MNWEIIWFHSGDKECGDNLERTVRRNHQSLVNFWLINILFFICFVNADRRFRLKRTGGNLPNNLDEDRVVGKTTRSAKWWNWPMRVGERFQIRLISWDGGKKDSDGDKSRFQRNFLLWFSPLGARKFNELFSHKPTTFSSRKKNKIRYPRILTRQESPLISHP